MMQFDLTQMPFSCYGAYLSVTLEADRHTFKIRNCRRLFGEEEVLHVYFVHPEAGVVCPDVKATPELLTLRYREAEAQIVIAGKEEILMRCNGFEMVVKPVNGWTYWAGGELYHNQRITNHSYTTSVAAVKGSIKADLQVQVIRDEQFPSGNGLIIKPDGNGDIQLGIRCTKYEDTFMPSLALFDAWRDKNAKSWQEFESYMPAVSRAHFELARSLWFNLWSCFVAADGNLKYDAILMSKTYMCGVWSWDHCFNALALLKAGMVEKSLEQFFLPFEMQSPQGKLPDLINTEIEWRACVKPPVHGWCFGKIMDAAELPEKVLRKAYQHLAAWTDWHFAYRDSDGDGIPEYIVGNDSGWDNSTVFDLGNRIESPDLSVYLFLQMKTLARIAKALHMPDNQAYWEGRAEDLMARLLQHSMLDGKLAAMQSGSHITEAAPSSLLLYMPLAAAKYLPEPLVQAMVSRMEQEHLTAYGLATEAVDSPRYAADGYWRGPIWAPPTYLIVDGLRSAKYIEAAEKITERFCALVAKSGSFENFNAQTGEGLRDKGYTWTASAALCLMHEYANDIAKKG